MKLRITRELPARELRRPTGFSLSNRGFARLCFH